MPTPADIRERLQNGVTKFSRADVEWLLAEHDRLSAALGKARDTFKWLDVQGGLGQDKHREIAARVVEIDAVLPVVTATSAFLPVAIGQEAQYQGEWAYVSRVTETYVWLSGWRGIKTIEVSRSQLTGVRASFETPGAGTGK